MKALLFSLMILLPAICPGQAKKPVANPKADEIAWKTVKFGATEKEFKKVCPNKKETLGDHQYDISTSFGHNGKLNIVGLSGPVCDEESFLENVPIYAHNLIAIISSKYGEGIKKHEVPLSASEIDYKNTLIHGWTIGKKLITVSVYTDDGKYFNVLCIIQRPDLIEESDKNKFEDAANKF